MKMAKPPHLSSDLSDAVRSTQVLVRFGLRTAILCVFAGLGSAGFGRGFAVLALMSVMLCVVNGALRRELPFGAVLTHWDEGAAYAALCCLALATGGMAG